MITCVLEDGTKELFRHVTVVAFVLNDKKEILLEQRSANISNPNKYCLPGGFLDRGENTHQGILRELKEEIGLIGEVICLFEIVDNPHRPKEDRQNVELRYIVKIVGGKENPQEDEVSSIEWFSRDSLPAEDEFAFDHRDSILKYFEYLEKPFPLPIFG